MNTQTKLFNPARLAAARKAAKYIQQQVVEQTGLSQPYVSALEQGNLVKVQDDTIAILARVLAFSPDDLMRPAEDGLAPIGHQPVLDVARLRAARKAARLSQAKLVQRAGVSQSFISKLEPGRVGCTMQTMTVQTKVLGFLSAI